MLVEIENFTDKEVSCNCGCCQAIKDPEVVVKIQAARYIAKISFEVSSWNRCPVYNKNEKGKKKSSHIKGFAIDIKALNDTQRFKIVYALMQVGFTRIGISKNFIHVDSDKSKRRKKLWIY